MIIPNKHVKQKNIAWSGFIITMLLNLVLLQCVCLHVSSEFTNYKVLHCILLHIRLSSAGTFNVVEKA